VNVAAYKAPIDTATRRRTCEPTLARYGTDLIYTVCRLTGSEIKELYASLSNEN